VGFITSGLWVSMVLYIYYWFFCHSNVVNSNYSYNRIIPKINRKSLKLDLHNVRHTEVERLVENFVLLNKPPLTIITGNSDFMKTLVTDILNKYNMVYEQWDNAGEYKIIS